MSKNLVYIDKNIWNELVSKLNKTDNTIVFKFLVLILSEYHRTNNLKIILEKERIRECLQNNDHNLISKVYQALESLKKVIIKYHDKNYIEPINFIKSCPFYYNKNEIEIVIDERFEPFLKDLQSFIKMREIIARCKTSAILFYSYLKTVHNKNIYKIPWQDINDYCNLSFNTYGNFKRSFLKSTIKAISDKTGIEITFTEHFGFQNKLESLSFEIDESNLIGDIPKLPEPEPTNHIPEVRKTLKKPFEAEIKEVYNHYMTVFNRDNRYTLTPDRQAVIRARLEEKYTVEELKKHIDLHKKSDFHNGVNDQKKFYIDLKEHIFNKTKFDTRQQNIEATKPKAKDVYVKPIYSDSIPENTNEQIIDSIDFIFFVEKYYINDHNSAYRSHRKTAETFPEFWLRTMSLRR